MLPSEYSWSGLVYQSFAKSSFQKFFNHWIANLELGSILHRNIQIWNSLTKVSNDRYPPNTLFSNMTWFFPISQISLLDSLQFMHPHWEWNQAVQRIPYLYCIYAHLSRLPELTMIKHPTLQFRDETHQKDPRDCGNRTHQEKDIHNNQYSDMTTTYHVEYYISI